MIITLLMYVFMVLLDILLSAVPNFPLKQIEQAYV